MRKIILLLFILLALCGCSEDDSEQKDYIDCKWLKTQNTDGLDITVIVYCVSDCPEGDTVKDCSWVHLYLDTQVVEYQYTGSLPINTFVLPTEIPYTYEEN